MSEEMQGECEECRQAGSLRWCMLDFDGSELWLCMTCREELDATTLTRSLQEYEQEFDSKGRED